MKVSPKALIGLVVVVLAAFVGAGYVWYKQNAGGPDLDGRWKLQAGTEGCFTTVRFAPNPLSKGGGVSLEATNDRLVQMYYGTYTKKTNKITVLLNNPEAPHFAMTAESQEDALKLAYPWEGKDYACTYVEQQ